MRKRCANPNNTHFARYGGRGITVCQEWSSFERFLADMGERPPGLSLDRINNDAGYSKENCRWATRSEQQRNNSNTRVLELDGKSMTIGEWEISLGLSQGAVWHRLRSGWPLDKALTTRRPA